MITSLYQFYGEPVAPSKVIQLPINRAFIDDNETEILEKDIPGN